MGDDTNFAISIATLIIAFFTFVFTGLSLKKMYNVDLSVVPVSTRQWMGFPENVEICITNVSDNLVPCANALTKFYLDNHVAERKMESSSIKKGTALFLNNNFVDILKSFGVVTAENAIASGVDLDKLTNDVRIHVHCEFYSYCPFGIQFPIFKKECDAYLVWNPKTIDWRNAQSNELAKFT